MPYRKVPIVAGEIYHVFNRSVAGQEIFPGWSYYQRALETISFYSYNKPALRFSHYNNLAREQRMDFLDKLRIKSDKQIELLAFCLMPNHMHFIIREIRDNGISTFMRFLQNSLAKYFNLKTNRTGALFQSMFKAVRVESDEQLLHLCRYIHLNPLSSFVIKDISMLENYLWCSFPDYIGKRDLGFVNKNLILNYFPSIQEFKGFTFNQVDYQRELEIIKHLTLE